jgi:adenylate cyclase
MSAPVMRQRLLAIMEADGVGYSRLMSLDERATVAALDAARAVFRDEIEAHDGRVIDMAGDSVLAVFETATGAATAALGAQARLAAAAPDVAPDRQLQFRIGIHLGDVFEKSDGTVYGDGVNIAARLEALATPGGVAVSQSIRTAVQGHVAATFEDIGEQSVKNIAQAVRVYRLHRGAVPTAAMRPRRALRSAWMALAAASLLAVGLLAWRPWQAGGPPGPLPLAGSPAKTLAVLAFANLSDDKANEVLADGVSDELLNVLARVPGLRVVSRNSAHSFKGKSVPTPEMARQLGVGYLVEGSVRRSGERVRIAAQLTQGSDGGVLWSQTYDREYRDVLAVQTEVALQIASQLKLPLDRMSAAGSGTSNVEAWQLLLEGQRRPLAEREPYYRRALALDPKFVQAHLQLANDAFESGFESVPRQQARDRSMAHLETAIRLDPRSAQAYGRMASAESLLDNTEAMRGHAKKALELNPNDLPGLYWSARLAQEAGDMDQALTYFRRLADADPLDAFAQYTYANVLHLARRPKAALDVVERALALGIGARDGGILKAFILADLGRRDEARELARQLGSVGLTALLATAEEMPMLDRRTDLDAHQRSWVDLALGRHEAFVAHAQDHVHDIGWRADALFDPRFDPVRKLPAFVAWLEQCKLTQSHERAQAWRRANPPQGG